MMFLMSSNWRALLVLCYLFGCQAALAQFRANPTANERRLLVDVAIVGDNGSPVNVFPLGKCQGDCDTNSDCAVNLLCYLRNANGPVPPGCSGTPEGTKDYCYDPNDSSATATNPLNDTPAPPPFNSLPTPPEGTLGIVGDGGIPTSAFPLVQCQGDCDSSSDCAMGLICFERVAGQAVPGCSGTPDGSKDYCIRPEDLADSLNPPVTATVPVSAPVPVFVPVPVLVPVFVPVPVLVPVSEDVGLALTDPGDNYIPADVFPLGLCEGDCDGDSGKLCR